MNEVDLHPHIRRMRIAMVSALTFVAGGMGAALMLPGNRRSILDPALVTVVALLACLWIGGTAKRDAARRLDRVKRAYAATSSLNQLLWEHFLTYAVILGRILVMAAAGVVSALWGLGPRLSIPFFVLAAAMVLLTWPSEKKTRLLITRANTLKGA